MGWLITRERNHPHGDVILRHEDTPDLMRTLMRNFIIHGRTTEILGYVDGTLDDTWEESWTRVVAKQKARDKQYD